MPKNEIKKKVTHYFMIYNWGQKNRDI